MVFVRAAAELVQGRIGKGVEEAQLVRKETELILMSIHVK